MRYAFRVRRPTVSGRQASGVILVGAVVVALVLGNLTGIILSIGIAALAGYFLLRPPTLDFYVETTADKLVVHALISNKISLRDIRSVELHWRGRPSYLRGWKNLAISISRLFGSGQEFLSESTPPNAMVRFRKWVCIFMPFPPFILPRRNWSLWIEDAESLKDDLEGRLRAFVG